MADVFVSDYVGSTQVLRKWPQIAADLDLKMNFVGQPMTINYAVGSGTNTTKQADMNQVEAQVDTANSFTLAGVQFDQGGLKYMVKANGDIQKNLSPTTGIGTNVGSMTASKVQLTEWPAASSPQLTNFRGLASAPVTGPFTRFGDYAVMFRTAVAPLKTGSLSVLGTLRDGTTFNVVSDDDGIINTTYVKGRVDYNTGVVDLYFTTPSGVTGQTQADLSFMNLPGVTNVYLTTVRIETLRYNAVAFTYLPIDAELLGINPVRLPEDGKVVIFKKAYVLILGRTILEASQTVSNSTVVDVDQTRLSRVRVFDANNAKITTGYTVDLEAGTVTFTNTSGYVNPVRVEWRIQDMVQCTDAGLDGTLKTNKQISHDYPADGKSFVSSAVMAGDLVSRVQATFSLQTFDSSYNDTPGTPPTSGARFNDTDFPIVVNNKGAVTERFAVIFKSNNEFRIVGQNLGQILASGTINTDTAPVNPNTGQPYFTIPEGGWGSGWATGNTVRINTVAAGFPVWVVRTIRPSEPTDDDYNFSLLTGGGIDNPA